MKWLGNTSRVWQTHLPSATTRTAAVFLAGQAHHTALPLRLFESGEWFLFAGSQTPLTVLSSSLGSIWMSAHSPQDESYKSFDLFPRPSVCEDMCVGVWAGNTLRELWWDTNRGGWGECGAFWGHPFVWFGGAPCGNYFPTPYHKLPPHLSTPPVQLHPMPVSTDETHEANQTILTSSHRH